MSKQEAIEKIYTASWDDLNYKGLIVDVETVNKIIYQIAEPQKPVVPKFVADFYESIKDDFENKAYSLCLQYDSGNGELSSEFEEWFTWGKNEPIQTLVKMKLYGYEIGKEKLYTVEIPNPALDNLECVIVLKRIRGRVCLVNTYDYMDRELSDEYQLTESEIKKDFEWAWDAGFAKEAEND